MQVSEVWGEFGCMLGSSEKPPLPIAQSQTLNLQPITLKPKGH